MPGLKIFNQESEIVFFSFFFEEVLKAWKIVFLVCIPKMFK